MTRVLFAFCSLLLSAALLMRMVSAFTAEEETVLSHDTDPDPKRAQYIWNPFPGFCGENATMVRCAGVCPETCAFKSLKCPNFCGVNCVCKPGYVFEEKLELCILKRDCPQGVKQQIVETYRVFQ